MPPDTKAPSEAPIAFSGSPLDRADRIRADPEALAALLTPEARVLRLEGLDPLLSAEGALEWGTLDEVPGSELVFLGLDAYRACFAPVPLPVSLGGPHAGPANWAVMNALGADELAIYGTARSLVSWHARHRFCSVCGAPSLIAKGGWQRTCTDEACRAEHFPRVDPVTIMSVENEGRLLLGRQPRFPARRYTTLAGFIEPGETIEEAVAREMFEEAGVRVRDVSYVTSQPWPFPSSLMMGCHAFTDDTRITIDATELEDARWFTREEVAEALDATLRGEEGIAFSAPAKHTIAHRLLRRWVEGFS